MSEEKQITETYGTYFGRCRKCFSKEMTTIRDEVDMQAYECNECKHITKTVKVIVE